MFSASKVGRAYGGMLVLDSPAVKFFCHHRKNYGHRKNVASHNPAVEIIWPPPGFFYPAVEFYTEIDIKVHLYSYISRRQHGPRLQGVGLGLDMSS